MTATTRATHAAMLRNDALTWYERCLQGIRREWADSTHLNGDDVVNLFILATDVAEERITKADEFEAKDGAA